MNYQHTLPVTELKLDRSFILAMEEGSLPIVKATLQMAKSLSMHVVAEDIETQAQYQRLKACGCDDLQGSLIWRPISASG